MIFKNSMCILATGFIALAIPVRLAAQDDQQHKREHHKYKLIDVGTFGGPQSFFANGYPQSKILNTRGNSVGTADTLISDPYSPNCITDCFVAHAFLSRDGVLTDLGALPGVNTSLPFAISEHGLIVGISENGTIDPLTGFPEFDPVFWANGKIHNLGTFGGSQGVALGVNDRGQVVGAALNTNPDPFAAAFDSSAVVVFPGTTQAHAFLWQHGVMQDLGTLGGPDSVATYVNERGEVAGQSFVNFVPNSTTGTPTQDPFLWVPCDRGRWDSDDCNNHSESVTAGNGKMLDLGTLGGTSSLVNGLNNQGQVIGQSNLPGDKTHHPFLWHRGRLADLGTLGGDFGIATSLNDTGEVVGVASLPIPCPGCGLGPQVYHAFFWKQGVMTDLGTLDKCSLGNHINSKGQIVGSSGLCGIAKHAFMSEGGGPIVDLNSLVVPGSDLQLTGAVYNNDRGEIAGFGVLPSGDEHAYVLIPCDSDHPDVDGCDYDPVDLDALNASAPANSPSSATNANVPKNSSKFTHRIQY